MRPHCPSRRIRIQWPTLNITSENTKRRRTTFNNSPYQVRATGTNADLDNLLNAVPTEPDRGQNLLIFGNFAQPRVAYFGNESPKAIGLLAPRIPDIPEVSYSMAPVWKHKARGVLMVCGLDTGDAVTPTFCYDHTIGMHF